MQLFINKLHLGLIFVIPLILTNIPQINMCPFLHLNFLMLYNISITNPPADKIYFYLFIIKTSHSSTQILILLEYKNRKYIYSYLISKIIPILFQKQHSVQY